MHVQARHDGDGRGFQARSDDGASLLSRRTAIIGRDRVLGPLGIPGAQRRLGGSGGLELGKGEQSQVLGAVSSAGEPLAAPVRADMEARLGHDFSAVRVHTDEAAAASARTVGAQAYTLGQDLVFAAGRYEPRSAEGRRLLAHELSHVVQQAGALPPASQDRIGAADAAEEHEAHRVADRVVAGGTVPMVRGAGAGLLRAQDDPAELRRQLAELERRAAEPVSLPPEEVAAIRNRRDALLARLAAAVRSASRPPGGAAFSDPATHTAAPAGARPTPTVVGENPTPETMVRLVVEQRHFTNVAPTPEGGVAPIPAEALAKGARGRPVGPGYQTNAAIKVVDAQGHQVAFELAQYQGGGNPHAEAQGATRLRLRLAGRTVPGGRLVVAVDQTACGGCLARLRALAVELGVASFEVWAPAPQTGRTAGPKWTARTAATTPARPGPPPVSETPGGAAYRYEPRLIQGESFPAPGSTPPSSAGPGPTAPARPGAPSERPAGPVPESPASAPRAPAAEAPSASAPPETAPPKTASARPARGGRWSGVGTGLLGVFGPLVAGHIHQRAVQERVRKQAAGQGYVPHDAPSGEGFLYDLGAWLVDPSREAESSVSPQDRVNVPVWRARVRARAAAKAVGDTMSFGWDVGECRFDKISGRQVVNRREVVYRKEVDGRWTVAKGNASGTIDVNRIINQNVPDAEIAEEIFSDPCTA